MQLCKPDTSPSPSRDEVTGETEYKEVTEFFDRHDREIWEVVFETTDTEGRVSNATFETTDDHPWRLDAGVWARTDELQAGMRVLRAEEVAAKVVSVRKTDRVAPTFNLEVADFHTYFVGEVGVWVHNCPTGIPGKFDGMSKEQILDSIEDGQIPKVQELFGSGRKGLDKLKTDPRIPAGLTRDTVEKYAELLRRALSKNPDKVRNDIVQDRLEVLERILREPGI